MGMQWQKREANFFKDLKQEKEVGEAKLLDSRKTQLTSYCGYESKPRRVATKSC
jgi:hypothetical protein